MLSGSATEGSIMGPPASPQARDAVERAVANLRSSGEALVTPPDLFNAANDAAWESGLMLSQSDLWVAVYAWGGFDYYDNVPSDDTSMPLADAKRTDDDRESAQVVDSDGLAAWVSEHTDLPRDVADQVLGLEFEYMVGLGIIDEPGFDFRYYSRDDFVSESSYVDTDQIAQDAHRFLEIDVEVALQIFEAETEFLKMRGLMS